ncbi:MAG TPA: hypothetical protein EYP23_04835 [Thermoplasmata archaeon]|nr:hypothetical protein [Thermoplasmata archaeon]
MNVVVVGKSGAGKQPRIDVLKKEFKLEQLSTGDIFCGYLRKFNEYNFDGDLDVFGMKKTKGLYLMRRLRRKLGQLTEVFCS